MDNLQKIAAVYYLSSTQEFKDTALAFFKALDKDGDGEVDIKEFLKFLNSVGFKPISSRCMFNKLDNDGNGTLDFLEVLTLYYLIKSGRPTCDACEELVTGEFFTCVPCYRTPNCYDLCLNCANDGMKSHTHGGRSHFLDNYSMLSDMRLSSLDGGSGNENQERGEVVADDSDSITGGLGMAFKAFEVAVNVASNCTIM